MFVASIGKIYIYIYTPRKKWDTNPKSSVVAIKEPLLPFHILSVC